MKNITYNNLHFTFVTIARGKTRFGVESYAHQILTIRENTTCNECKNEAEREYNVNHTIK